jgi:methyltransferase (TIGR00027 family)
VIDGSPSLTGLFVARVRALMDRPHSEFGDPSAQVRLCAEAPEAGLIASPRARNILARTAPIDAAVIAALRQGISQVVIVGAGYDDRALRFKTPGVRFFEVDHPSTQADKLLRLERIEAGSPDIVLVPCDLQADDVGALLSTYGHDCARASVFVLEGLLVYFDTATISSILSRLRGRACEASRLHATCVIRPPGVSATRFLEAANSRRSTGESEPWQTILELDDHLELVRSAGWEIDDLIDLRPAELAESDPSYLSHGGSVLVCAHPGPVS